MREPIHIRRPSARITSDSLSKTSPGADSARAKVEEASSLSTAVKKLVVRLPRVDSPGMPNRAASCGSGANGGWNGKSWTLPSSVCANRCYALNSRVPSLKR